VTHYMVPLLHYEIGIGNQLLDMLQGIINKHLENMTRIEEITRASIPVLKNIIYETVANRDSWDSSNSGKLRKTLKRKVEAAKDRRDAQNCNEIIAGQVSSPEPAQQDTHATDKIKLKAMEDYRNREYVLKLEKARDTLRNQQNKLKMMRASKVRAHDNIEMKMFSVLKELTWR
jgi:hypothetical protein